jgi:hypothetical protein
MTTQPDFEALLKKLDHGKPNRDTDWAAAAELRRQHKRISKLEASEGLAQSNLGKYMQACRELEAQLADVKEVQFPAKAAAVAEGWRGKCERLIAERDALQSRLAEIESAEPVAWRRYHDGCTYLTSNWSIAERDGFTEPLYPHPVAAPAPLSDTDISEISTRIYIYEKGSDHQFARAIEAAVRGKV